MICCSLCEDLLLKKSNLSDIFLTLICQQYLVYPNTIKPVMFNCVCNTYIMYWETVLFSCKYTQQMGLWCTCVCICTCICMHVFVCACVHVCMYVYMYIYRDVCMYVYVYVLMYMYIYIFFFTLCLSSVLISHSLYLETNIFYPSSHLSIILLCLLICTFTITLQSTSYFVSMRCSSGVSKNMSCEQWRLSFMFYSFKQYIQSFHINYLFFCCACNVNECYCTHCIYSCLSHKYPYFQVENKSRNNVIIHVW